MCRVRPLLTAILLGVLISPPPARAAWLSEVFLGGAGDPGMPSAIEISGLDEPGKVELVIMDAGNAEQLGTVQQIIRFEATGPLHLLSDGEWPSTRWTDVLATLPEAALLDLNQVTAGVHDQFDLAGARRIHLYAGHTHIKPGTMPLDPAYETYLRGDAELLDVLTLAEAGQAATAHDDEIVTDTRDGWVLLRPEGFEAMPDAEQWLIGSPDAHGYLTSADLQAKVTPGQANPYASNIDLPEPSSLLMAIAGLGVLACRRRGDSRLSVGR